MAERLGRVLYVIGWLIGIAIIGVAILVGQQGSAKDHGFIVFLVVFSLLPVGIGYGLRYILAGR